MATTLVILLVCSVATAEPTVVPTFEGQFGETPDPDDKLTGSRVAPLPSGEFISGDLLVYGGLGAPPPEVVFIKIDPHTGLGTPVAVDDRSYNHSADVARKPPGIAPWLDPDDDIAAVFAHVEDGSDPSTMAAVLAIVPSVPGAVDFIVLDNIPTTPFPDDTFQDVGITVDDQGRFTFVFTEDVDPTPAIIPRVKAQRFDGLTGLPIGGEIDVNDGFNADVAALDPAGNRIIISASRGSDLFGNIVDFTGPTPVVLPEFPISTTSAFANFNPAVAADLDTGAFVVAWENLTAVSGDPVNIRARRFDANGNPDGPDYQVNTSTDDAQGQPELAFGPDGDLVIVWASDPVLPGQDQLDVFLQAYDAMGNPIGGETRAHSGTSGIQDRPAVRFLPEPDSLGQSQFVVNWRDVGEPDGSQANGTGNGYTCFSIGDDPQAIFADGFESGDTSSWSTRVE